MLQIIKCYFGIEILKQYDDLSPLFGGVKKDQLNAKVHLFIHCTDNCKFQSSKWFNMLHSTVMYEVRKVFQCTQVQRIQRSGRLGYEIYIKIISKSCRTLSFATIILQEMMGISFIYTLLWQKQWLQKTKSSTRHSTNYF